jgi:hypothetical protein
MEREKQSLVNKINLLNKEIKLQRTDIKTLKFHLEKSESARYRITCKNVAGKTLANLGHVRTESVTRTPAMK